MSEKRDSATASVVEKAQALRRSFPSAADVRENVPDPATREMLEHLAVLGCHSCFDRFDAQKPHCTYGLAGTCCRNCSMGPCRITPKAPVGTCGADADVIVARNLLRWVAAAVAAHGARSREVMLALRGAARGEIDLPVRGEAKARGFARALGVDAERPLNELASEIADVLLEDLARIVPGTHRTLAALAPPERVEVWSRLGILPLGGAQQEVFEALHRTGTGTDGDPRSLLFQMLRCGLAFAWSSVVGGAVAMDILYGPPRRSSVEVNLGVLEDGWVNLAVHGHSPVLVEAIVAASRSPELVQEAQAKGALGVRLYGICCSGLSAMYRWGGVHPLANAVGAELALATGALDLWVVDMQDVYPAIMEIAQCVHTPVITTSDSCRLPGANHIPLPELHGGHSRHDGHPRVHHEHPPHAHHERPYPDAQDVTVSPTVRDTLSSIGARIVREAIRSHGARRHVPRHVPQVHVAAEVGHSAESVLADLGGASRAAELLRSGAIRGIVNLVGCNNPKVPYERTIVDVTEVLLENDILVLTNGCASFPLLKAGYCHPDAIGRAGARLSSALRPSSLPPVVHLGECLDNARASGLFRALSDALERPLKALPFAFASPEWSNEKGVGAALSFRLLGLNSYHCVRAPTFGSDQVERFLEKDTQDLLGSVMVVDLDPKSLALRIVGDLDLRRRALGWAHPR